ncbi:MAG: hypothetical protein V3S04_04050 [Candidatus Omnitrophota bacterium]
MKAFAALIIILAFVLSVISVDTAYAGWKENYREKYSKKTVKPGSAEEKRIKTLMNMDFTWNKNWNYGSSKESNDKFQGYNTNYSPGNISSGEPKEEKVGRTMTGLIQEAGKKCGDKISEKFDISERQSSSVK